MQQWQSRTGHLEKPFISLGCCHGNTAEAKDSATESFNTPLGLNHFWPQKAGERDGGIEKSSCTASHHFPVTLCACCDGIMLCF